MSESIVFAVLIKSLLIISPCRNQNRLPGVMQTMALSLFGRGRTQVGDGMIHVAMTLKGRDGPIIRRYVLAFSFPYLS